MDDYGKSYYDALIELGYEAYHLDGMSDEELQQLYCNETEVGMFLR